MVEVRRREVDVPPDEAFAPIRRIGGETGWYAFDGLWALRGWVDRMLGGVGARRGRPDPDLPKVGEPLDAWRVTAFEPGRRLGLHAETKLPGTASLEFEVAPSERGALITQTLTFEPSGVLGRLYWYAVLPLHGAVFEGMLDGIERAARAEHAAHPAPKTQHRRHPRDGHEFHDGREAQADQQARGEEWPT